MSGSPYAPPNTTLRDASPEPGGPLPDLMAGLVALATIKALTMYVSEVVVVAVFILLAVDPASDVPLLVADVVLSFGFELLGLWMAWRLSRSRALRVPLAVAVLSWLMTFVDRWFLNDYGWPQWYELTLLTLAPLALLVLRYRYFRRRLVPASP